jgi:predicted alpha/beta superfamily hydrolase
MKVSVLRGIYLLIILPFLSLSQVTVNGKIANEKGEKLSFVNIGIKGKNVGVCASEEGAFSIRIPQDLLQDTLHFALIGYENHKMAVSQLISSEMNMIILKSSPVFLNEVPVTVKKLVERKFGITKYNPVLHFMDGSVQQNDIFEIAQVLHLPVLPARITSVNLFINENRKDSGIFRINFYELADDKPGEKLNKAAIYCKKAIQEGWLRFDIRNENVYLKGDVVVGIEFIPAGKGTIKYEVKVGGSTKSFVRTSSFGNWMTPPHHYRLFATALVEDGKSKSTDDDEKESVPVTKLHLKHTKDSMHIFVSLPKKYSRDKKSYPVVYVLDANVYFDLLKGNADNIIVGIGYKNAFLADSLRDRDYTYPVAGKSDTMKVSGGGLEFLNFIDKELIPYIDKKYRSDSTDRTLMGHSLGGYFTLFAMSYHWKNPGPFQNYVAASPHLEYFNGYLLEEFRALKKKETKSKNLFMTSGGEEHLKEVPVLETILKNTSVNVKTHEFSKMHHMETAVITFKTALSHRKRSNK